MPSERWLKRRAERAAQQRVYTKEVQWRSSREVDFQCIYRSEEPLTLEQRQELFMGCKGCGPDVFWCSNPEFMEDGENATCTVYVPSKYEEVHLCRRCEKRKPANKSPFSLVHKPVPIGKGHHRSGWPYAYASLSQLSGPDGIVLDDFIEQNWCYSPDPVIYDEPWVGIFHHPPNPPSFSNKREWLWRVFETSEWKEAQKHLKLAIALSKHLADWLRKKLPCPVEYIRHPCEIPMNGWKPDKWKSGDDRMIIALGWYLRNTRVLHQANIHPNIAKLRLLARKQHVFEWDESVRKYWSTHGRSEVSSVATVGYVSNGMYDTLLCENVIITEVFDASANNVVIDCIARNTPLIVNRHPAVVDYLGSDYPLYFTEPAEIDGLLRSKVFEAHEYLRAMDKIWMDGSVFAASVADAISRVL